MCESPKTFHDIFMREFQWNPLLDFFQTHLYNFLIESLEGVSEETPRRIYVRIFERIYEVISVRNSEEVSREISERFSK